MGSSEVTLLSANWNLTPLVSATPDRSIVCWPIFCSSMNSNWSLSVLSPAGLKCTSLTRSPSISGEEVDTPAVNCTGSDQWLQRPVSSFIRTRTR